MTSFDSFELSEGILKALKGMGYEKATPIQEAVLPTVLKKESVLALAETGSGKTAACGIPVCELVDSEKKVAQALVLVPTRELALQYATELQNIGKYKNVVVFGILGGECIELQKAKIAHGVHIIVSTPGRLIDLIYSQSIDLSSIERVVLDEADKMVSMGFIDDVSFILDCLIQKYQFLMFSATMPKELKEQMVKYLGEHKEFFLNSNKKGPDKLRHLQYFCHFKEKSQVLQQLIKDKKPKQSMIFCSSRIECEKLHRELSKSVSSVDYLHGGLNQNLRTTISQKFDKGRIQHLVVTDVAGRGLDFKGITHVFIYTLTKDIDAYVHRSGRTARSNREGECISLVTAKDFGILDLLLKKIGKEANWIKAPPQKREHGSNNRSKSFKDKAPTKRARQKPVQRQEVDKPSNPPKKVSILKPPEFKPNLGLGSKKKD
ncbi:MAG: DEAD/DEAH box helicase [Chlamydiales bacterium]|nr:DEAD/DEAH box helicase [Chlamydiales bacterium]